MGALNFPMASVLVRAGRPVSHVNALTAATDAKSAVRQITGGRPVAVLIPLVTVIRSFAAVIVEPAGTSAAGMSNRRYAAAGSAPRVDIDVSTRSGLVAPNVVDGAPPLTMVSAWAVSISVRAPGGGGGGGVVVPV